MEGVTARDIIETAVRCARILEAKKGCDIRILDLRRVNSYLDFFIITSGNSQIHCRALSREAEKFFLQCGIKLKNRPDTESRWILMDFDEIILHVFTGDMRDFYQLEKLWADATIIEY